MTKPIYISKAHSEFIQTSNMEFFAKIVSDWKAWTIFAKNPIIDVWQASEYAPVHVLTKTSINRKFIKYFCFLHFILTFYAKLQQGDT